MEAIVASIEIVIVVCAVLLVTLLVLLGAGMMLMTLMVFKDVWNSLRR